MNEIVEMVEEKEFTTATFDLNNEILIVDVILLANIDLNIYLFCRTYIASVKADKALIASLLEYINFADIIFLDLVIELSKYIKINDYTINLINGK